MYRFLQTHGKKLMAVFSVFLMIAFALPSASKYAGGSDTLIGRLGPGGEKIKASDLNNAKRSWEFLKTIPAPGGQGSQASRLPPEVGAAIEQHPLLYVLLQKEAQRMGVTVSRDDYETALVGIPIYASADDEKRMAIQRSMADLMLVIEGFKRGASAIKVSEPMTRREMAELGQSITVNAVSFDAKTFADKVPPPTADQLKTQFDKYANVTKGSVSAENPFGFGYKYADRLKLQYIAVPRDQVRQAVEASRTPYEWRVEAQKYYIQHESEFAFGASTTLPSASSTKPAASTKPIMQPFGVVADKIKGQLIDAETARRADSIVERINQYLASDWVAYHNSAPPAPGATTAPSSLKVPYDSFEYLQKVAAAIQGEFKVQPTVVSLAEKWLTLDDLKTVAGLGKSMVSLDLGEAPGPLYLVARTSAFQPAEHRDDNGMLRVFEPARPLKDSIQTTYLARISAAEPTHRPASFAEVEPQVKADVIEAKAYDLAKAEANKLLDAARQKGLADAVKTTPATTAPAKLVTVGPLKMNQNENQPPIDQNLTPLNLVPGPAANQFIASAFDLIATPTSRPSGKPVAIVELQRDGRAFVAELGDVQAVWTARSLPFEQAGVQSQLTQQFRRGFVPGWFSYPSVIARTNFVPDASYKQSDTPNAPPPQQAPLF